MEVSKPGDPRIGRYYFVRWAQSCIVDHNQFYEQLKALLPPGTEVYGGQERHIGPSDTGVVDYHAVLGLPFISLRERFEVWSERQREEYRKWEYPTHDVVVGNLTMILTGKDEEVTRTDDITVQCPERIGIEGWRDLPCFFGVAQQYIEKCCMDSRFGDRIDPQRVSGNSLNMCVLS